MGFLDKLFGASKKKKVHHHQNDEASSLGGNEKIPSRGGSILIE
jgi:hypothetical protein